MKMKQLKFLKLQQAQGSSKAQSGLWYMTQSKNTTGFARSRQVRKGLLSRGLGGRASNKMGKRDCKRLHKDKVGKKSYQLQNQPSQKPKQDFRQ
jgi:hypothetical protein